MSTLPSVTTTATWWSDTTINGIPQQVTETTTWVHIGGSYSFWEMSFPPSWSSGTTNPNVVWLATSTTYESATGTLASLSGLTTSTGSPTSTATIPTTAAITATSTGAANALYGHDGGSGSMSFLLLAVWFALLGVVAFRRRL